MKKTLSLLITGVAIAIVLTLTFCKKQDTCVSCNSNQSNTSLDLPDGSQINGIYVYNPGLPSFSIFDTTITRNIIISLLDSCGITYNTNDSIYAASLFYSNEVDTSAILSSSPNSILLYSKRNNRIWVQLYNKNSGDYISDSIYRGVTNFLTLTDILNVSEQRIPNTTCIVMLVCKEFNNQYPSSFQENLFIIGGGSAQDQMCKACKRPDEKGWCVWTKAGTFCNDVPLTSCPAMNTDIVLSSNSYSTPSSVNNDWYEFRDNFLLKTEKGHYWLDDWYYSAVELNNKTITLSAALAYLPIRSSNLPRKLKNINNALYADTILFTSSEKTLILNLCEEIRTISSDNRFNAIVDSVESSVNRLVSHTTLYVKDNL